VIDFVARSAEDGIVTGLPFTLAFLGVWIVFRIQRDFDLTVDGTFSVGGAIAASWIVRDLDPWLALLLAAAVGGLGGLLTYSLMRLLNLSMVLTSITVSLGLYSAALFIMGQPNLAVIGHDTIYTWFGDLIGLGPRDTTTIVALSGAIVIAVYVLVGQFLKTELGLAMRASGINPQMSRTVGISPSLMLMLAVILGNALAGMSGALLTQQQGFADVSMGVGIILFGITAVLLGEVATGGYRPGTVWVWPVLLGALLYRSLLAAAFRAGVPPQFFQGMTAVIVLGSVAIGQFITRQRERRVAARSRTRPRDRPPSGDGPSGEAV
jgi:putative tryptophan/tyrosine transport system permease protein